VFEVDFVIKYRLKKRIKIDYKPSLESSKPRKYIEDNLLKHSAAQDFNSAKNEWIILAVIDETCDGFSEKCELCHTSNLKHNFVLQNTITGSTLRVGSTCIIRFGVIKGIVDVESGIMLLQNKADEAYLINEIQTTVQSVMVLNPDSKELSRFIQNLKKLMELRGVKNPTTDQLGEVMFGQAWKKINDPFKINRVRILWDKPGTIETRRTGRIRERSNPKEGTTWYKKRRPVINTSLSKSEIYNVERHVTDKS